MYFCRECGEFFEVPKYREWREYHVWDGEAFAEDWAIEVCPYCGAEEPEEADRCEECGEMFSREDLTYGVCPECIEKDRLLEQTV